MDIYVINDIHKLSFVISGRYQIAACFHDGFIYAIGGTDGWVCSSVTEMYDIEADKWLTGPSLNVGRRGAGCDILNGKKNYYIIIRLQKMCSHIMVWA